MKLKIIWFCIFLFPILAFANADTFICNYPLYSDMDGLHKEKKKFQLIFIIDKTKNLAYMVGNLGTSNLTFTPSEDGGVTFLEVSESKNFFTTTIDSKLSTVHSRNTMLFGKLIPSQYYGTCVLK